MKQFIYIIICLLDNKIYVGTTNNPERRWREHLRWAKNGSTFYIHSAIRKHNVENFQFHIIESHESVDEALKAEISYIAYLIKCGHVLYNMTDGGQTAPHSNRGAVRSQAYKDHLSVLMSGEGNHFYGKKTHPRITSKNVSLSAG